MSVVIGYVTFKNKTEAKKICSYLIQKKIIACANIFPSHTALYEWKGKSIISQETAAIIKTKKTNLKKAQQVICQMHSYDVPCVVFWPLSKGHPDFLSWIHSQTLRSTHEPRSSRKKNI